MTLIAQRDGWTVAGSACDGALLSSSRPEPTSRRPGPLAFRHPPPARPAALYLRSPKRSGCSAGGCGCGRRLRELSSRGFPSRGGWPPPPPPPETRTRRRGRAAPARAAGPFRPADRRELPHSGSWRRAAGRHIYGGRIRGTAATRAHLRRRHRPSHVGNVPIRRRGGRDVG